MSILCIDQTLRDYKSSLRWLRAKWLSIGFAIALPLAFFAFFTGKEIQSSINEKEKAEHQIKINKMRGEMGDLIGNIPPELGKKLSEKEGVLEKTKRFERAFGGR